MRRFVAKLAKVGFEDLDLREIVMDLDVQFRAARYLFVQFAQDANGISLSHDQETIVILVSYLDEDFVTLRAKYNAAQLCNWNRALTCLIVAGLEVIQVGCSDN